MRTIHAFLPRGFGVAALALVAACSGTPSTEADRAPDEAGQMADQMQQPSEQPMAQQPGAEGQGPAGQRREFLVTRSLEEARRSLELRLYSDAEQIASQVLEIDPTNQEARKILQTAEQELGQAPATVAGQFQEQVRRQQAGLQKVQFESRQQESLADALMEDGRYGDAVERYQRALLLLRYSPYTQPGSELQTRLEQKLEGAKQAQAKARQAEQAAQHAASQAELREQERRMQIQREAKVGRLMEEANTDFQLGNYRMAVELLDQALRDDPNNANALSLRALAERARHENRMDVLRNEWAAEWSKTFDDLNTLDVPQVDPIVYDLEAWSKVQDRQPLSFTPPEELETPEERAIIDKLQSTRIEHRFASAPVEDWARYYAGVTDVTFLVTPGVRELDPETTTLTDFALPPMSVYQALDVIGNVTGVRWKVEDGVVKLVTPEQAGGRRYLVQYEVRDIVQGVRDRPGPDLKLTAPGEEPDFGFGDEEEPLPTVIETSRLVDLIRANIAPETWDEGGASITEQRGVLLVRHDREVHQKIQKLLADLREAVGIQVDVETRFLEVEDQFLEDIGVDFRGLGNQAATGLAGRGLENRPSVGFDDFGQRNVINPATPSTIGTGTEPGFFYDDGQDGDILARTENLFDRTLGSRNGLQNGGGLSLQWAYLNDAELEVVLRAVAKDARSELITAPRLLVYNNTRASMHVLRQTSYIRDFDVEIAQAAAVANPIIDVVKDGVVLDVRPVVSADRRFITMELRPTVMNLQLPIPTFTTTLGVGQPVSIQLPEVTRQSVRTTVTMPDGGTLMLGGMKLAQKQYLVSQVPILGDIPVLSFLFSRKGTYIQNKKILILIRATIVIPAEHEPEPLPDELQQVLLTGK